MVEDDREVEEVIEALAQKYAENQGSFPEAMSKDTHLQFMRDVRVERDDELLSRTANLTEGEVGSPRVPSLVYANCAGYAETEGLDLVALHLRSKMGDLSGLSLSRKAKLLETLFTVRRETKNFGTPRKVVKKGLFSNTETVEGVE